MATSTEDTSEWRSLDWMKEVIGIRRSQDNLIGMLFLVPNVVVFSAFMLTPVLFAFYISFTEWSILGTPSWVGLDNYVTIFTPLPWENNWAALRTPDANLWWWSVKNTLVYAIGTVPLSVFGGLGAALLFDKGIRAKKTFRAIYFMPVMLSGAASAIIWRWVFSGSGILNYFLEPVGLAYNWAGSTDTALFGVMTIAIWAGIGFNMIFYLAGLQNIPDELYESARLDGANAWQRFRRITWPNLSSITFFVLVLAVIKSFQVFAYAYVFSENGGPYYATTTIVVLIYKRAFEEGQMGVGSAMAVCLFLMIFAFSYYQYRLRDNNEEAGY
ncbi:carbohydrate ABC transporter permease [Halocatena marina]|uniref:carbohydrate ABC transporter permease n=2 Tax=Halocatena marina TaxID=2934937 RepID=UPI0022251898|nr:sugar ABC transporter permease [Halocatena marina]